MLWHRWLPSPLVSPKGTILRGVLQRPLYLSLTYVEMYHTFGVKNFTPVAELDVIPDATWW